MEEIGLDLLRRYAEAGRYYHNMTHVGKMLAWLDRTGAVSPAMELAVWFHDAVYEPLGRENEAESAAFFERTLGPVLDAGLRAEVVRHFLSSNIFSTVFLAPLELVARSNLQRELELLSAPDRPVSNL